MQQINAQFQILVPVVLQIKAWLQINVTVFILDWGCKQILQMVREGEEFHLNPPNFATLQSPDEGSQLKP